MRFPEEFQKNFPKALLRDFSSVFRKHSQEFLKPFPKFLAGVLP